MKRGLVKGFVFIEVLLVFAIILFMFYLTVNYFFKKPVFNKTTEKFISEQGIATTNYKSITDSVRVKIDEIQKQRIKELEDIK